jgi:transposase InsO family protein
MGSGYSVTHQSPSEWQHLLPACLLGFDRTGLAPAGFHQEVSPSHLRFPLFQVFPSAIFTVPTLTFGVLYCFFVIAHDRRRILHCNVTRNPSALWVGVQLRAVWQEGEEPQRFLLFDRDSKFAGDVVSLVKARGSQPLRTAFRSPWQNGVAERWVGSVRRDLLDHVILLNERHLRRLLNEYIRYYHADRTHLGLGKDTPVGRIAESTPASQNQVISLPRLGGLHHRYAVAA